MQTGSITSLTSADSSADATATGSESPSDTIGQSVTVSGSLSSETSAPSTGSSGVESAVRPTESGVNTSEGESSFVSATSSFLNGTEPGVTAPTTLIETSQPAEQPQQQPTTTTTVVPHPPTQTPATSNWLPTVLVTAATATDEGTLTNSDIVQATGTAATSGLPRAITPADPIKPAPDYQVITIGFKAPLNYPFVVKNSISSAQIFQFLPEVLKFPFISTHHDSSIYKDVSVNRLIPFTSSQVSYTITVAEVYFPSSAIAALSDLIISPGSLIYRNPDSTQNTLASLIDARVALVGLATSSGSGSGNGAGDDAESNPLLKYHGSMDSEANAAAESSDNVSSGRVAAIAVGAASGCGIYLSLMLFLFKRYKNNSGNIELESTDSESRLGMSEVDSRGTSSGSPTFSGMFGRFSDRENGSHSGSDSSARGKISVPVKASNSLGWYQ
ncbi:uncharacterized protein SPAPADRAFT_60592 [Spathaspora passalidarum NRRL Y-27907]|uniref:Uncharacterized protein n=1 Tax=Spathaspora passalidarum (strain NRRL Y-27907 / 11-Y1) TaxID=619300 RepID=G3ALK4_SPAPN|nr:uncharacterized protein SPAPADRAFT_60592 [Spathaspora passalidarum NRRL Y-27907]EGW33247.1 hypothetical protein SPAPADRAFT_60592 [Spathaspora passalidarum NRRL Y-27907]